ncbi:hypothetical protein [Geobacillus sp. YF-1]|uniref:hypothetical protein n=1 Tax=Geobacillus sp. YF-1 TaxID=3457480 RepID=UPI004045DE38
MELRRRYDHHEGWELVRQLNRYLNEQFAPQDEVLASVLRSVARVKETMGKEER